MFSAAMSGMMAVVGWLVGQLLYGALLGAIPGDVARTPAPAHA